MGIWKKIINEPDPISVVNLRIEILARQLKKKGILNQDDFKDMDYEMNEKWKEYEKNL